MRIFHAAFLLMSASVLSAGCMAQPASNAAPSTPAQNPPARPAAPPPVTLSALLQPSLDAIQQTLSGLKLEKWKGNGVRAEAASNISSIQRDLESTLPPLLATADAAPGAVSKVLPVTRNIDALYDVVLRVVDSARVSAPGDQFTALQQSLSGLEQARRRLNDHLQDSAAAQEKQVSDLQASLKAQQAMAHPVAAPPPAPEPCPTPKKPPARKRKPAAATPQQGSQSPGSQPTTTKPQN